MRKIDVFRKTLVALFAAVTLGLATPAFGDTPPVNVNTANAAELTSINGIGPSKAEAIVEHRSANGPFASVEDLQSVRGIGDKLLERIRPQVTVGESSKKDDKTE